jgi:GNAT superfamily N-acetyltransferase
MDVDPAAAVLALHPFRELPSSPGTERIEQDGILLVFNPFPIAQPVEPLDLVAADVPLAVAGARAAARARNKRLLAWWIAPEHADLGSALEQEGLVNEDTPGFEAIENTMVLVEPPAGGGGSEVAVSAVESYADFTAAMSVVMNAFELPEAMRAEAVSEFPQRWNEYRQPGNPGRQYIARIENEVVGTATATFGDAGINLFGGAVLPHARGRGVYRALTMARWEEAVQRGTPALTVQAGRMSMPILTKLGFTPIEEVHIYVDAVEAGK